MWKNKTKNKKLKTRTGLSTSNQFEILEEENIFVIFKSALRRLSLLDIDPVFYIVNHCVPVKYKTLQTPNNLTLQICFASKILIRIQYADPDFGIRWRQTFYWNT